MINWFNHKWNMFLNNCYDIKVWWKFRKKGFVVYNCENCQKHYAEWEIVSPFNKNKKMVVCNWCMNKFPNMSYKTRKKLLTKYLNNQEQLQGYIDNMYKGKEK